MTDPTPPALVIFDCDGVLVDSEPIANRVFGQMLAEQGLVLEPEAIHQRFVGLAMADCLRLAAELLGHALPVGFEREHDRRLFATLAAELVAVPGVAALLDRLAMPYCVASNGSPDKLRLSLRQVGLLSRFEGRLFSAAQVARRKPAPDLFLHAARCMGTSPETCVVIEDTPTGIAAGVAAGMRVFGFASGMPAARLREAGAQQLFEDMCELPSLLGIA